MGIFEVIVFFNYDTLSLTLFRIVGWWLLSETHHHFRNLLTKISSALKWPLTIFHHFAVFLILNVNFRPRNHILVNEQLINTALIQKRIPYMYNKVKKKNRIYV